MHDWDAARTWLSQGPTCPFNIQLQSSTFYAAPETSVCPFVHLNQKMLSLLSGLVQEIHPPSVHSQGMTVPERGVHAEGEGSWPAVMGSSWYWSQINTGFPLAEETVVFSFSTGDLWQAESGARESCCFHRHPPDGVCVSLVWTVCMCQFIINSKYYIGPLNSRIHYRL